MNSTSTSPTMSVTRRRSPHFVRIWHWLEPYHSSELLLFVVFNGFESTVGAAFGIWQGISTRLYDKAANRIVHRARTDYGVEFVSKLAPNSEGVEVFLFDITGGATK